MKIENISISKIKENKNNPRTITKDALERLVQSIKEDPEILEIRPIVIDKDNIILGGNMRLKALKQLGYKEVPVIRVLGDWKSDKKKRFIIKDNVQMGQWDVDLLKSDFDLEFLSDIGLDLKLLGSSFNKKPDDDEIPEVPKTPKSKVGDLYEIGGHKVLCGDANNPEDLAKLMGGVRANMLFTDPPYNVDYGATMKDKLRGNSRKILNDKMSPSSFKKFLSDFIRISKPYVCGDVYICMSSSELHTLHDAFVENGGHWSTFIIWVKNTFTIGRSNYQRQYEPILYGWFENSSHFWSGVRNLGDVYKSDISLDQAGNPLISVKACEIESDIWEFNKPTKNKEHPTMKPVALVARAVENSSKPGGVVLDQFLGSGSTLIACEKIQRKCFGIELDPKYVDVIVNRYVKYTENSDIIKNGKPYKWESD